MERRKHTEIKASETFWQKQLEDRIFSGSRSKITKLTDNRIHVESIDDSPEQDIIELSKQNPDQVLTVTYTGEDHFENLAATYQYLNGKREFVKEEYKYWFEIPDKDLEILPPGLYERFQQKALEHFRMVDNYRIRTDEFDPTFQEIPVKPLDYLDDSILIPSIELWEDGFKISAKKFGLTHLMIKVEHFHGLTSPRDQDHLSEEYDDWMGEEYEPQMSPLY